MVRYSAVFEFEGGGRSLVGNGQIRTQDPNGSQAESYSGRCGRTGS